MTLALVLPPVLCTSHFGIMSRFPALGSPLGKIISRLTEMAEVSRLSKKGLGVKISGGDIRSTSFALR